MVARIETDCPIPKAHSRLRQTHDLWHAALDAYADVDEFVLQLNSCIQAARSVTFVLQKELKRREWFGEWYAGWQERMKADPRMRWLVRARNAIEKEGDLDTASVALVSVAATDDETHREPLRFDPKRGLEEIAEIISLRGIPARIRAQAVMIVERRWTVAELPDDELLDALAHCYGILAELLIDAHERCGVSMRTFGGETHGSPNERNVHPSGRLSCMLPTSQRRTAYWHLGEEHIMTNVFEERTASPEERQEIIEKGRERYPEVAQLQKVTQPSVEAAAAWFHEAAKIMLRKDRHHISIAWPFAGDVQLGQFVLDPEDHQDKIVDIRLLATEIDRLGADAVIMTFEVWYADAAHPLDPCFGLRASERRDRRERLMTYLLRRTGKHHIWHTPFEHRRGDESVVLGKTSSYDTDVREQLPLFRPIFDVWSRWDR
jgi:hypothetical protein